MSNLHQERDKRRAWLRGLWPKLALLGLLPLGMGARGCERIDDEEMCSDAGTDGGDCKQTSCQYGGKRYQSGDSFPSTDGCNQCGCGEGGGVVCTKRACIAVCNYGGKQYQSGDSFASSDGCNQCTCQADGSAACTEKACQVGAACGGLAGLSCKDGEYCNYAPEALCGAADATGTCTPTPEQCTLQYEPVCGCDDETYGNACSAAAAGVSVVHKGACESEPGAACGGLAGLQCKDGEYCNYAPEALCGAADATGTCTPTPEQCTLEYDPVCGCDDETYGNACSAAAAGVSVVHKGACESEPGTACGGLAGLSCEDGEYCNYAPEALCGAADATGTCTPTPDACTREYNPVCGCDDMTYGNACTAAAAGVSVVHRGACDGDGDATGETCGGLTGKPCPDGQYCHYPREAMCGAADRTGTCEAIPDACTFEYSPVCGCDDETYGNACAAAAAGVSVATTSACP